MGVKHGTDGMHAPKWKWEWSPNSLAILVGIAVTIGGMVYTVAEVRGNLEAQLAAHAENISEIREEVRRIELETRRFERLEFRVDANERRTTGVTDSLRTVEQSIVTLSSDMRLVREIVERLERSQNGGRSYESPTPFRGAEP